MHKAQTIHNLQTFAKACKLLSSEQIYKLFEDIIEAPLRNEIINLAPTQSAEPVRAALNIIGKFYEVDSLIQY